MIGGLVSHQYTPGAHKSKKMSSLFAEFDIPINLPQLKLVSDAQLALFLTFFEDAEEENEFQKDFHHWPHNQLDALVAKDEGLKPLVTAVRPLLCPHMDYCCPHTTLLEKVEYEVLKEVKVRFAKAVAALQQVQDGAQPRAKRVKVNK